MSRSVVILMILVLVAIVIAVVNRARLRSGNRVDRTQGFEILSTDVSDESTIEQLKNAGSDTSKVTEIVHYLYVPNKGDATEAASALTVDGYNAEVRTPLGKLPDGRVSNDWSVV